jgi:hypothetical protein
MAEPGLAEKVAAPEVEPKRSARKMAARNLGMGFRRILVG